MKSFATSICPIKNPLALNMRHPRAIPAPSQRHTTTIPAPYHRHPRVIPAPSSRHPRAARPSPNRSQNGFFPVS